jgi:hypothetical protein
MKQFFPILYIVLLFNLSTSLQAEVIQAGSCNRDSVQAAIDRADYGDSIMIPADTAVWHNPVTIQNKSIFIFGISNGENKPAIIDSIPTGWQNSPFWIDVQETDTIRISNLRFYTMVAKTFGSIFMIKSKAFRVDHCEFYDSTASCRSVFTRDGACGVIDNCVINVKSHTQGVTLGGDGDASWERPSSYGTIDNIFIEDCEFNFDAQYDGAIDAYHGARVVFRHNVVNGTSVGWHGYDSGGYRSPFSFEIYNNVFNNDNTSIWTCMRARGGSALVYNNIITGNYSSFFVLSNYRSCADFEGTHTGGTGTTLIDTTASFSGSNVDYVYKILTNEHDTVVSFTDTSISTRGHITWENGDWYGVRFFCKDCGLCFGYSPCDGNESDNGYPCMDQIGRGTNQSSSPFYFWNNVFKGDSFPAVINTHGCERETGHIQKDRDYFENTEPPFEYEPFTYPHPLRGSGSFANPTSSPNLQINRPNPFMETTTINYQLETNGHVTLKIYDKLGREIITLVDEVKQAGTHTISWDGTDSHGKKVPSGTYFYQIRGENEKASAKKMIFF